MANNGPTLSDFEKLHPVNPELAAHNIALAYMNLSANSKKVYYGDDADGQDVLSLSLQYLQAYNYAYNYVVRQNTLINEHE